MSQMMPIQDTPGIHHESRAQVSLRRLSGIEPRGPGLGFKEGEIAMGQSAQLQANGEIDPLRSREMAVVERIREISQHFTVRQVANIQDMSISSLKALAERHNISFHENSGCRTKRIQWERIAREKQHTQAIIARSVKKPTQAKVVEPTNISPHLKELARRSDELRWYEFLETVRRLSCTHTKEQVGKMLGVSPRYMRNLAYQHEILFVDERKALVNSKATDQILKSKKNMFRPNRSFPAAVSQVVCRFMIDDTPAEI